METNLIRREKVKIKSFKWNAVISRKFKKQNKTKLKQKKTNSGHERRIKKNCIASHFF